MRAAGRRWGKGSPGGREVAGMKMSGLVARSCQAV